MKISEFIKEQAEARAKAAQALIEPLEINGIEILAGCTEYGIRVAKGIEQLADILETDIKTAFEDCCYDTSKQVEHKYFIFNDTEFYSEKTVKKESTANEPDC